MFIGPPAEAIEAMGSKTRARELMRDAGVPIVPGHDRAGRRPRRRARGHRRRHRLPGRGQGRGRRRRQGLPRRAVARTSCRTAFEGAAREGEKFFSDPTVYLERYLPDPRHVEVQVLADGHGNDDPPRRARLLDPAPPPEAHRGVAGAAVGRRRRPARAHRPDRRRRGRGGRLPRRGHGRGPARRRRVLLPGDEHPRPGRALRDRDDDRRRHRQGGHPRRRRRAAVARPGRRRAARPRDRVPHQRRGRGAALRARAGAHRRLPRAVGPGRARRLGRRARQRGLARCTTRWWPSSSSGTPTASRPRGGCCARSPSTRSRA